MHRLLLAAALAAAAQPAAAQVFGRGLTDQLVRFDIDALRPVVRGLLDQGRPGETRPWSSDKGEGRVTLLAGGAAQGERCGRVRLTSERGRDVTYTVRFCRNAQGEWRTAPGR